MSVEQTTALRIARSWHQKLISSQPLLFQGQSQVLLVLYKLFRLVNNTYKCNCEKKIHGLEWDM